MVRIMKKIMTTVLAIMMVLAITCQPVNASAAAAKPVVKAGQTVISVGTKTQLKAMSGSKNVTGKATWASSNKKVATVSKKGIVAGKKAGTSYITATYKGKTSKKVKITVAEVKLSKTSVSLTVGKTATLTAKYNGKKVKPAWKSSNAAVATVDKGGKVTAIGAGTATITATYKGSKASCEVTVTEAAGDNETGNDELHTHDYNIPVYKTIHHDEVGHMETVTVQEAWDEEVVETEEVWEAAVQCSCGERFTETEYGSIEKALDALTEHTFDNWGSGTCQNYHSDDRKVTVTHPAETVHHEAVTEQKYIVDAAAYDEQVIDHYKCSCGAEQ